MADEDKRTVTLMFFKEQVESDYENFQQKYEKAEEYIESAFENNSEIF